MELASEILKTTENEADPVHTDIGFDILANSEKVLPVMEDNNNKQEVNKNNNDNIDNLNRVSRYDIDSSNESNSASESEEESESESERVSDTRSVKEVHNNVAVDPSRYNIPSSDSEDNRDNIRKPKYTYSHKNNKKIIYPTVPQVDKETETNNKIKKLELIRLFNEYRKKGFDVTPYNMNSNIDDMQMEYEILKGQRTKQQAVKISQGFLINGIQALEFLSNKYNPFDTDLNGFSEIVALGIDDYDEVLGEIYEKYKNVNRRIEPELKLVLMVGASAASFSASKSLLSKNPVNSLSSSSEDHLPRDPVYVNKIGKHFVNSLDSSNKVKEDEIEKSIKNKSNAPLRRLNRNHSIFSKS